MERSWPISISMAFTATLRNLETGGQFGNVALGIGLQFFILNSMASPATFFRGLNSRIVAIT